MLGFLASFLITECKLTVTISAILFIGSAELAI